MIASGPVVISFEVLGSPKPAGSKRCVAIYNKLGPVVKNGRVLTHVIDDNPKTADWKQQVAQAARQAYDGPLLTGPIRLELTFERPRPRGHFRAGKNAHLLRGSAPAWPTTKPDTVKLTRAVEDALSGVVWKDDSQVVVHNLAKRWGVFFRVCVTIREIE